MSGLGCPVVQRIHVSKTNMCTVLEIVMNIFVVFHKNLFVMISQFKDWGG